jgi:hypothetical protein
MVSLSRVRIALLHTINQILSVVIHHSMNVKKVLRVSFACLKSMHQMPIVSVTSRSGVTAK